LKGWSGASTPHPFLGLGGFRSFLFSDVPRFSPSLRASVLFAPILTCALRVIRFIRLIRGSDFFSFSQKMLAFFRSLYIIFRYDISGNLVRTLYIGEAQIGDRSWTWNGLDDSGNQLPSGNYIVRAATTAETALIGVTMIK